MSTTNNNKPETQTTDSSDSGKAASVVTQSAERNVAIGPDKIYRRRKRCAGGIRRAR